MGSQKAKEQLSKLIKAQMILLGSKVAIEKAKKVIGLEIDHEGNVLKIIGNEKNAISAVIDEYIELTGDISKALVKSLM